MPKEFDTIDQLFQVLRPDLAHYSAFSIGIDDIDGSGKSKNGKLIASEFPIPLVFLDGFLNEKPGSNWRLPVPAAPVCSSSLTTWRSPTAHYQMNGRGMKVSTTDLMALRDVGDFIRLIKSRRSE